MKQRRRFIVTASIVAVTVSLLTAPVNAAAAGPADNNLDPVQAIAQTYLASFKDLTPEAAHAAAVAQSAGEPLKDEISKHWKTFGGGWFDPFTATYNLAVTDSASAEALTAIGATHRVAVRAPLVARSFDELEAKADELRGSNTNLGLAASGNIGVDVTTNKVVVAVPAERVGELVAEAPAGVAVVAAEKLNAEDDTCVSRADCDNFLAAGVVLRTGSASPPTAACSLGFTARNAANQRITLTAGHCTAVGQSWSNGTSPNRVIGTVSAKVNSGHRDAARIASTNSFYGNVNSGQIYIAPRAVTVPVKGKTFLIRNDVVCLSAAFKNPARFGNPCARVTRVSDPFNLGLVRIEGYDACPGDSGGGWYWLPPSGRRYAVALHKRSNSGCNNGSTSWASPLTAFYPDLRYETS